MKLTDNDDLKTHLEELRQHFQTMQQCHDNLLKIRSEMSDSQYNIIIMLSLPESYRSTLQTITVSQLVGKLSGAQSKALKADNIMSFIIEEAQHRVINNNCTKYAESALAACMKKSKKSKGNGKGKEKNQSKEPCSDCKRTNHAMPNCKGGAKEGQGPRQKNVKKTETVVIATDDNEGDLFAFTCTSDHAAIARNLDVPKLKLGTCIDSGASKDYCPDRSEFSNYKSI